jgi:hypothetical protein
MEFRPTTLSTSPRVFLQLSAVYFEEYFERILPSRKIQETAILAGPEKTLATDSTKSRESYSENLSEKPRLDLSNCGIGR